MKTARPFPNVLLLPLTWLFLSSTRGVMFWRPPDRVAVVEDYAAGSPLDRTVFIVLILLALWVLFRRRERVLGLLRANGALVLLFLLMAASMLWSQFPYVTLKRFVRGSGTLLMALVVLSEDDPAEAVRRLLRAFFLVMIPLTLLFIHGLPWLGTRMDDFGRSWVGLSYTKNNLGQLASSAALYCLWSVLENRSIRRNGLVYACLATSLYLLAGSRSVTSLGAFALGAGLLLLLRGGRAIIQRTTGFLLLLILILAVALPLVSDLALHRPFLQAAVESTGRNMTFTGRTPLWGAVFGYVLRRPVLGYGYGAFWLGNLGNNLWARFVWEPNQAHNGYLDILVDLGFVGLGVFLLFLLQAFRAVVASFRDNYAFASLALAFMVMICFANLFESSFIRLNHQLWCLFLQVAVACSKRVPAPQLTAAPA